ncbi:MAG: PQQ-binding-like beta-propeller repeat protein [Chloroflexota bacterium]|nr:PQQ-binding-like beta-propeller repeat protein [Chloroflexota bacterium]
MSASLQRNKCIAKICLFTCFLLVTVFLLAAARWRGQALWASAGPQQGRATPRTWSAAQIASPPSCCVATGKDFPKVGGDYGNQNYSALSQITPANIGRLGAAWHVHLEDGKNPQFQQNNAIVVDGVIYVETTQGNVYAVNGATGKVKWSYKSGIGDQLRRGLAVGDGKVFAAFADNKVGALDQGTGAVVWMKTVECPAPFTGARNPSPGRGGAQVRNGGQRGAGVSPGGDGEEAAPRGRFVRSSGSIKSVIVYYGGMIYFGAGSSGQPGEAVAMKAATGDIAWEFWGVPGPGEFGHDTWGSGDTWERGGAVPWMSPAIDPKLGLIYWTFGNARGHNDAVDGSDRPGLNLFANSLVAMDLKTGKRVWYFQSVHHDIWDLDNVMAPVLADLSVNGKLRHLIIYGGKTSMYYVLDRTSGEPITPIVETPVPQSEDQKTWPTQPIPEGDLIAPQCMDGKLPATTAPPGYVTGCVYFPQTGDLPVLSVPGVGGGMTFNLISFDQKTNLIYTGYAVVASVRTQNDGGVGFRPLGENRSGGIAAYNPVTHKVVWRRQAEWDLAHGNGVLTTAGGVLFIGQPDGLLLALDPANGKKLWQWQTGAGVHTSPAAYEVGGKEYITVFAGGSALPYNSPKGDDLWAFALGGTVPQAPTPPPPSHRQPIYAAEVEGSAVNNTVNLARQWFGAKVGPSESNSPTAMAPENLHVPVGASVTFLNPVGNTKPHCAMQFYEGLFQIGPLQPGQSSTYIFTKPGEYFYNDCTDPRITGKVVVGQEAQSSAAGSNVNGSAAAGAQLSGEALVQHACSSCHGLARVRAQGRTPEQWEKIVEQMIASGAQVNAEQAADIVHYLSRTYPSK